MKRGIVRSALMAVLTLSGMTATALPALASGAHPSVSSVLMDNPPITPGDDGDSPDIPLQMCQASGTGCMRDANNLDSYGNFIVTGTEITGPAENAKFVYSGQHITLYGSSYPSGTLKLTGHTNMCVGTKAVGTDPNLYTRHCSGDTGTTWLHGRANGADVWISRLWTFSSFNGPTDFAVAEGFDPNAHIDDMIIDEYSTHSGFVRYEFR